jgi:hypothetical protein
MLARIPLHPLDTVKAKMQVQQQFTRHGTHAGSVAAAAAAAAATPSLPYRSFFQLFPHTYRHEGGLRGLYSGFGITFVGSGPAACLYFTSYETSKEVLGSMPLFQQQAQFFTHFLSGLLAECASCVLWVPIDVVKERLQVQEQLKEMMMASKPPSSGPSGLPSATAASSSRHPPALLYRGNLDAIRTIARTEGLRGVYRGYGATVASFGPFSAIYLSGYEQFKELYGKWLLPPLKPEEIAAAATAASSHTHAADGSPAGVVPPRELPFYVYALSGASAGGVASVLTNPLDLVKLRMQVQRGNSGFTFGYRHIVHGLATIVREEGAQALFKGAAARCMFHIPSTALTIAMFDTLRNYFTRIRTAGGAR